MEATGNATAHAPLCIATIRQDDVYGQERMFQRINLSSFFILRLTHSLEKQPIHFGLTRERPLAFEKTGRHCRVVSLYKFSGCHWPDIIDVGVVTTRLILQSTLVGQ
ncbi:hypothetical protein MHYP_G00122560 [Metynnis hypsauchen]